MALSRVLGTLDGFDIILCSPSGTIPKGIAVDRVSAAHADILDPYTLLDIFQEDDIVYNAQILDDKDDLEYMYKKLIAVGAPDTALISQKSGMSREGVDRQRKSFQR